MLLSWKIVDENGKLTLRIKDSEFEEIIVLDNSYMRADHCQIMESLISYYKKTGRNAHRAFADGLILRYKEPINRSTIISYSNRINEKQEKISNSFLRCVRRYLQMKKMYSKSPFDADHFIDLDSDEKNND